MMMDFAELQLLYLACHLVGDFAFQSAWMAMEKGKSWEVLFYHSATYTAPFIFTGYLLDHPFSILCCSLICGSHVLIDATKARWKLIKHIWVDQLLHLLVIRPVAI